MAKSRKIPINENDFELALVTTVTPYTDTRNRAYPGDAFDGVVRVAAAGYYGTGVLLFDGRAVLTAAHLFTNGSYSATVHFETEAGDQSVSSSQVSLHSNYDPVDQNHDLALVWLTSSAPTQAERHNLYRDSDEIGRVFSFAGYGVPGTGDGGTLDNFSSAPLRLKASNRFDVEAAVLKTHFGSGLAWDPAEGSQLIADFDNGSANNDALGRLIDRYDLGLGLNEGLISPGDSGGPAFIDGLVAGVASYTASLSQGQVYPDIDGSINSSFGEIAAWQRISHYQQWIDQSLRANYPNAPTKPDAVIKAQNEGNSGTSTTYFLLQFTGVRDAPDQWLSVDYATRDGTAKAGEDYIAVHGKLILYPDENQAVIPVELIGDYFAEPDETFYLDVTHPVGGSFGEGVAMLTAMRTLINDDVPWF